MTNNVTTPAEETAEVQERRRAMAEGLHCMAEFIRLGTMRLPYEVRGGLHIIDHDEFDAVCAILEVDVERGIPYDKARVGFGGGVYYSVQTDSGSRLAQREARIAERERELGLSDEDLGA